MTKYRCIKAGSRIAQGVTMCCAKCMQPSHDIPDFLRGLFAVDGRAK